MKFKIINPQVKVTSKCCIRENKLKKKSLNDE